MKKPAKIALAVVATLALAASASILYKGSQLSPDISVGTPAPAVSFTALDGSPLPVASLQGKVVLLDFWGST